ncbi:MAG: lipid A biosynthesis acyltransferase [Chitinophagaceae bacterium]|nr:lipid A biosynthesis acyltransferase [Chitinophagaceae bacterium]
MPSWRGKSKGTPLGYRIFVAVLKNLGVFPAYFMLRFVAFYYFLFSWKSTTHSYHYFNRKLGYKRLKSLVNTYQNYYEFGQSIIDKVVVMSGMPNKFTFDFDGEENLHQMVAMKKGGLLLSAHIGNWEIAGHLLKRLNTQINIVMFDGENEQIKEYLSSVTGKMSVNVILIKNDLSHIYEISEAFKNNELVCMHADRFMDGNKTLLCSFLDEAARFPMGPFVLAARFRVPVSFVFGMKESSLHYHFFASRVTDYSYLAKNEVMEKMLKDFVGAMEQKVKQYPRQWFNYYNFWQQ